MMPVFVVLELYGDIVQSVHVYQHIKDAQTHWEKQTGLKWSEYDAYAEENHEKDEVRVYETNLRPEFDEEVVQ